MSEVKARIWAPVLLAPSIILCAPRGAPSAGLESIETIVVIYAENRSFDNLYGYFPGANGLAQLTPPLYTQRDRDGTVLKELPPIWGGLTETDAVPRTTQAQTMHLPN